MKLSRQTNHSFRVVALLAAWFALTAHWRGASVAGQGEPPRLAIFSAASFTREVAPDSIAAVFGVNLAARAEAATTQPLPTTLGGATVTIAGRPAPLFFVSPGQINLLIPPETAPGAVVIEARLYVLSAD